MVSTIDSLPCEIQKIVYGYLEEETQDIKQCALVCKRWRLIYQAQHFSNISINNFSKLKKFNATVKRNSSLGGFVHTLFINFYFHRDSQDQIAAFKKLLTRTVNVIFLNCCGGCAFQLILNALSTHGLPRLKFIGYPAGGYNTAEDFDAYAKSALLLKDRLYSLGIPEEDDQLFNKLDLFKNLKTLSVYKKVDNVIESIENILKVCSNLRYLNFHAENDNSANDNFDISTFSPAPNICNLTFENNAFRDSQLVNYIMHKFPQLECLTDWGSGTCYLDDVTFVKFSDYLSKLKEVDMTEISLRKESDKVTK